MKIPSRFLNGGSLDALARRSQIDHLMTASEIRRQLYRLPDGSLCFMDGTPIRAGQLVPGENYQTFEAPQHIIDKVKARRPT